MSLDINRGVKMANILSALILSISANLDNLLIGISYGNSNTKITKRHMLIIGLVISIVTFAMLIIGEVLLKFIPGILSKIIGAGILILIGVINIISLNRCKQEKKEVTNLSYTQALILGFLLSINNILICFAVGISGTNIFFSVIFSFVFSVLFLYFGNKIGKSINTNAVGVAASVLLIILGIYEIIF